MAVEKGENGTISVGGSVVGKVSLYEFREIATLERIRTTGASAPEFMATSVETAGSVEVFLDAADVGQGALTAGAYVTLTLQRDGAGSGKPQAVIVASVGEISERVNPDEHNKASFSWQGGAPDRTPQV